MKHVTIRAPKKCFFFVCAETKDCCHHIFLLSHFFKAHGILWSDMQICTVWPALFILPLIGQTSSGKFICRYFHLTYYKWPLFLCFCHIGVSECLGWMQNLTLSLHKSRPFLLQLVLMVSFHQLGLVWMVWFGWFLFCLSVGSFQITNTHFNFV